MVDAQKTGVRIFDNGRIFNEGNQQMNKS